MRTAYGVDLERALTSAGLTMHSNPRMPEGEAFVLQAQAPGVIGFEVGLTVESFYEQRTKSWTVLAYVVPALAVDRPHSIKRLTGLSS